MKKQSKDNSPKPRMKRRIKDSVFSCLFKDEKYRYELYKFLHPEDQAVRPQDVKLNTLETVLVDDIHNDLCINVNNRMMIFVEAQSTFDHYLPFRLLLYAAYTYRDFVESELIDFFHKKDLLPKAEFYMIYSGDRRVPGAINLSDIIEGIDLKVKILTGSHKSGNNIVYQYVEFCKIAKQYWTQYPHNKHKAIVGTINECIEKDVLAEFLQRRRTEVMKMMDFLFDQERITKVRERRIRQESLAEGEAKGEANKALSIAKKMLELGSYTMKQITELTGLSQRELRELKASL